MPSQKVPYKHLSRQAHLLIPSEISSNYSNAAIFDNDDKIVANLLVFCGVLLLLHTESEEEEEGEDLDHNDTHCAVCHSDKDGHLLLCCESCPTVMHTRCCNPPLEKIPKGDWFCPQCQEAIRLGDQQDGVEKILDVRTVPAVEKPSAAAAGKGAGKGKKGKGAAAAAADGEKEQQQQQQQEGEEKGPAAAAAAAGKVHREYFVKWKGMSYMHCSWVRDEVVQRAYKIYGTSRGSVVRQRFRKFMQERGALAAAAALQVESGALVNGVDPNWLQVRGFKGLGVFGGGVERGLGGLGRWQQQRCDKWSRGG